MRLYFRADAAFASPEAYEFLEFEGFLYAIRLPANRVLQENVAHLLTRPVGRPPNHVRRYYASFSYPASPERERGEQAKSWDRKQSWDRKRRVVAKVVWHPGELYPRVGLDPLCGSSVTNLSRPAERVVAFYNQRGTAEQWTKEGKNAVKWTRLSPPRSGNRATEHSLATHGHAGEGTTTAVSEGPREPPIRGAAGPCGSLDGDLPRDYTGGRSWWLQLSRSEHFVVVQEVVGSNPFSHPRPLGSGARSPVRAFQGG